MDLQILNDRMRELENELKDIRAKLEEAEKKQKSGRWKPQSDEIYFYINQGVGIVRDRWTEHGVDEYRYLLGNVYKTEEEANFEEERLKVLAEMREFEESPDRKWDCRNSHYCVSYNARTNEIKINWLCVCKSNDIFFETEEKAQECIDKVGIDRIKRFYLRIKED